MALSSPAGGSGQNGRPPVVPSAYAAEYEKAAAVDPALAALYLRYATIDDPPADRVVAAMAHLAPRARNQLVQAGMNRDAEALRKAPRPLRAFFEEVSATPSWWDPEMAHHGCRAFHKHSALFIQALFMATVKNASTLIAKAFHATGRVNSRFGPRRIRQNSRHFIEIMLPGALDGLSDGWRLSVRIRLVHAQIRHLVRTEGDWDEAAFGVPLSSAHMGLASANFSATILELVMKMGLRLNRDERASFMQIWRHASLLIGTPEELLFEGDEARTRALSRVAHLCEPPPGEESLVIAHALFDALPGLAGKSASREVARMVAGAHRTVRAVMGDKIADQLRLPKMNTVGFLTLLRSRYRLRGVARQLAPTVAEAWRGASFAFLLDAAVLDDPSYKIPDRLRTEEAAPW